LQHRSNSFQINWFTQWIKSFAQWVKQVCTPSNSFRAGQVHAQIIRTVNGSKLKLMNKTYHP